MVNMNLRLSILGSTTSVSGKWRPWLGFATLTLMVGLIGGGASSPALATPVTVTLGQSTQNFCFGNGGGTAIDVSVSSGASSGCGQHYVNANPATRFLADTSPLV